MKYVLFNQKTSNPTYEADVKEFEKTLDEYQEKNVVGLNFKAFLSECKENDEIYLVGGDGTLNNFINGVDEVNVPVYLYPCGTGNDFARDVQNGEKKPIYLNDYIKNLPVVEVNGMTKKFINGIGYGIDGYCCEVGDKLRAEKAKVDYTSIAIQGLLFHFKRVTATVTVDGKTETFKNVWLAPTMKGRFYGGGMMVAPKQDRTGDTVSLVVFRGASKIHTLMVFPSIFKGEHVKHDKMVFVRTGKEIEVKFDKPTALQIDGETVVGVTSYKVKA